MPEEAFAVVAVEVQKLAKRYGRGQRVQYTKALNTATKTITALDRTNTQY